MPNYSGRLAAILFILAASSCFLTAVLGPNEERAARIVIGSVSSLLAGAVLLFDIFCAPAAKPERWQADNPTAVEAAGQNGSSQGNEPVPDLYIPFKERSNDEPKHGKQARQHIFWAH